MKVRSSPKTGRVVLELGREETTLPPAPLPEIALKRIMVPVDFSATSGKALHYAVLFARQFGAEILLLHVVERSIYLEGAVVGAAALDDTAIQEAAARRLSEWRQEIQTELTVKSLVRTGLPHQEIVQTAEETNTELIILGTQGLSGLAHVLIGSTAERVVRLAPCPVLVIREKEHDFVRDPASATETRRPSPHLTKSASPRGRGRR